MFCRVSTATPSLHRAHPRGRATVLSILSRGPMPFRVLAHATAIGRLVPTGEWQSGTFDYEPHGLARDGRGTMRSRTLTSEPALSRGETRAALQSCVARGTVRAYLMPRFSHGKWPSRKRPMRVFELTDNGAAAVAADSLHLWGE
jgi:hypothetical protein